MMLLLGNSDMGTFIGFVIFILIPLIVIGIIAIAVIRLLWRLGNKK